MGSIFSSKSYYNALFTELSPIYSLIKWNPNTIFAED